MVSDLSENPTERRGGAVRDSMKALLRAISETHRQYPDLDLAQFLVLLHVMVNPGLTGRDLLTRTSVSKSTLSRNIRLLSTLSKVSDGPAKPRDGLGLISQVPSELDARYNHLAPTKKLWLLAERLSASMED